MTRFEVTACVLVHRDRRWLLGVRRTDVGYDPGRIGLIGGHVEFGLGLSVLEDTARREVAEETGIDLSGVPLHYLESIQYEGAANAPSVDVTFVAAAPAGAEPVLAAPDELSEVRWWDPAELVDDPRCPDWLPALLERATAALES